MKPCKMSRIFVTFLGMFLLPGCAAFVAAKPVACGVISTLHSACILLTFVGSDGKPHTVACSQDDMNKYGAMLEERARENATH